MKGLLKFITCGSVDDGKSTLIGHILYDSKLLYADQEQALELDSKVGSRGGDIDYSLLLDGLMAEREQGITIDVAYRYFTTSKRSFIVADTPGHEEYTRNMAVGASFADLAIILVDATKGVLPQTKRHTKICSLMGIKHFVYAINKMDLVEYNQEPFTKIVTEIKELVKDIQLESILFIPISATEGDNLTKKSKHLPWYEGEALLTYLEELEINEIVGEDFYLPVQRVCRPNQSFRGFEGQVESGHIAVGEELTALPSGGKAIVKEIFLTDQSVQEAVAGDPVTIQLDREVDVSRGCVLSKGYQFKISNQFIGTILWMDGEKLTVGTNYFVKLGTKLIPGVITKIVHKVDIHDGSQIEARELYKNEIARCEIHLDQEIVMDEFNHHKTLGEFILIDRISHMTSACGVVEEVIGESDEGVTFIHGEQKITGDFLQEYYFNLDHLTVTKTNRLSARYTIGDIIPVKGETYGYPDYFDILALNNQTVIQIRNKIVTQIIPIGEYQYTGLPLVNERGFEIRVASIQDVREYIDLYQRYNQQGGVKEYQKFLRYETYRGIIFHQDFWVI